eukprot:1158203-Pelagomonas_calceolata.AAC.10
MQPRSAIWAQKSTKAMRSFIGLVRLQAPFLLQLSCPRRQTANPAPSLYEFNQENVSIATCATLQHCIEKGGAL